MASVLEAPIFLSADQSLLTTLIVKLAVMAVIATMLANSMINRGGPSFIAYVMGETSAGPADIVRTGDLDEPQAA